MANLHRDASFVVRIWWERRQDGSTLWRGQVVHAPTGEVRYFDQVEELVAFIERWAGHIRLEVLSEAPPDIPPEEDRDAQQQETSPGEPS